MANIGTGEFASQVSNAGGLGIIATGAWDHIKTLEEIRRCKQLTDKPFGVNLMLLNPNIEKIIEVVLEEKPAVVTTGAGNPGVYVERLKNAGIKVFPVVSSVALAKRLERYNIDGFIAEGCESGGHVGEATTMALLPQIISQVNVPVIAAGGFASGKGLNAALALGAIGIQVGTCLLVSNECPIHDNYKDAVIKARDNDTVVTGRCLGAPVRILKNKMTRKYLELESKHASRDELEALTLGGLRRAVFDGDIENGSVMLGQIAGLVKERKSLNEILSNIVEEAIKEKNELILKIDSLGK